MPSFIYTHFGSERFWNKEFERLFREAVPDQEKQAILSKVIDLGRYSHPHLTGHNTSYKKFIILSKPRGGSTYLVSLLQSHHNIACFNELFLEDKCAFFYQYFPKEDNKELLYLRDHNPKKFLRYFVFRKYTDTISAVGFKIFYKHGTPQKFSGIWELLKNDPDLHIIHLIRKNHLRSLISLKIAEKTGRWTELDPLHVQKLKEKGISGQIIKTITDSSSYDPFPIDFNVAMNYFMESDRAIEMFSSFFSSHLSIEITYEDLEKDMGSTTSKVLEFIGIQREKLCSRFKKQNIERMSDVVVNYTELKDKFSKTKWAGFFEE